VLVAKIRFGDRSGVADIGGSASCGVDPSRVGRVSRFLRWPTLTPAGLTCSCAEQAQAQSHTLREQVAELAEAVAQVELDVARVHEGIAEQGGSLAAQAREHATRAREFAAREHAEAERVRMVGLAEDRWPERAN
jgi:hypothetical protein